jgi:hypothetical protein
VSLISSTPSPLLTALAKKDGEEFPTFSPEQSGTTNGRKHLSVMKIKQSIRYFGRVIFVTTAMILATPPMSARDQVPFRGTVSGSVTSITVLDECNQLVEVVNGGNATHLGRFTGTAQFVVDICNLTYVGSYVFTAANGDSISGPFVGTLTPTDVPGVFDNSESAFITGGTGRFAGATGSFDLGGQIHFNTGTFSLPFEGIISTVGSGH